jgi:hypothetical protein
MVGAFTLLCLIVLPHTPQVVAFEQSPQPIAAGHEYSAALAQSANPRSSFVHYANAKTSTDVKAVAASLKTPALSGPRLNSNSRPTHAAILASRSDSAASLLAGKCEAGNKSNAVAMPDAFIEVNVAFAQENSSPAPPTVVFVQESRYVGYDSGFHYMVWRIEVWRVTVVNSVWKHKAQAPVAHSA